MRVKTRAVAVVAHIHNNNVARIAKPFGDHAPISGRPIKTMGDEKRGTCPEFIVIQHDCNLAALIWGR